MKYNFCVCCQQAELTLGTRLFKFLRIDCVGKQILLNVHRVGAWRHPSVVTTRRHRDPFGEYR